MEEETLLYYQLANSGYIGVSSSTERDLLWEMKDLLQEMRDLLWELERSPLGAGEISSSMGPVYLSCVLPEIVRTQ